MEQHPPQQQGEESLRPLTGAEELERKKNNVKNTKILLEEHMLSLERAGRL